jgi:hypothetical protein
MRYFDDPDSTQREILKHLETTERLLAAAASKVSGRDRFAEIVPMPDLGLPHNIRRIHGGFFTGAYYSWESDVPIVPVDSTVNLCGVALYKISAEFGSDEEFQAKVEWARSVWETKTGYVWNYAKGNHFIIYGELAEDGFVPKGRYLALHASTAEFKGQYNGLFPANGNWYADDIEVLHGAGGRYLRYLSGRRAESFYRVASMLEGYLRERHRFCAGLIAGESGLEEEIISLPHYGMPDQSSVAIGCQWMDSQAPLYLLLTRPEQPLYLVRASTGGANEVSTDGGVRLLTPHGLGVESAGQPPELRYLPEQIEVTGRRFGLDQNLASDPMICIRGFDPDTDLSRLLAACPGQVGGQIDQVYSYYRDPATPDPTP